MTLNVNKKDDNEVIPSTVSIGIVLKVSPDNFNKLKMKEN